LEAIPSESTNFWVYLGDGSARKYTLDRLDYTTLTKLTQVSATNVVQYPDGSSDFFGLTNTIGGVTRYFLTQRQDLYGNTMVFQYLVTNSTIRLDKVLDVDNRSITFEYISAGNYSNVVSKVIAPHGLTNVLQYDSSGRLTNIIDPIGLSSKMQYDTANLTALVTPYGTNTFTYFSISNLMDAVKVTELGIRTTCISTTLRSMAAKFQPITPATCRPRPTVPTSLLPTRSITSTAISETPSIGGRDNTKPCLTMFAPI